MKFKILIVLFVLLSADSFTCFAQLSVSMTANWNEQIDPKLRDEIKILNDQVIYAFYEREPAKLIRLYSERLKQKAADKTESLVNTIHQFIKTTNYTLLDQYLVSNLTGTSSTVFKGISADNDYKIVFDVHSKEEFISLIVYTQNLSQWIITTIYSKHAKKWELETILIGQYKLLNKNAIEFYKKAKADYNQGNLIGAANNMLMSKAVQNPGGGIFIYFKEPEIESFRNEITKNLNKIKFPITLKQIKTLPQIFGIDPAVINEGVFPEVKYLTRISLKDTLALKSENDQMKTIISIVFPGIGIDKKFIFFKAYNQIPNGKTAVENYGFMLKNIRNN